MSGKRQAAVDQGMHRDNQSHATEVDLAGRRHQAKPCQVAVILMKSPKSQLHKARQYWGLHGEVLWTSQRQLHRQLQS